MVLGTELNIEREQGKREREQGKSRQTGNCFFTFGGGGGGGGGYTVGADILSSADWYHHSIIYK
jgi:hypothetical protein